MAGGKTLFSLGILFIVGLTTWVQSKSFTVIVDNAEEKDSNFRLKRDVNSTEDSSCKPDVQIYTIESDIKYRYAKTTTSSKVANPCSTGREISFTLTLPESAYISEFLLIIKDKSYKAYVKEKEEAKKVYTEAKQAGATAGHVELSARDSNVFTVSVNVEPSNKVTFNLTYEHLLDRILGVYEHVININPGQIVPLLEVIVNIKESSPITVSRVSEFKTENEINESTDNKEAKISRPSDDTVNVKWSPSVDQQKLSSKEGLKGQLIIRYDVDRRKESSQILVQDGYFVHFFAPTDLEKLPKYLIFILDISGSMSGTKLEQLKEAMNQILTEVTPDDYFTIMTFSSNVEAWVPSGERKLVDQEVSTKNIISATEANIKSAVQYISTIHTIGATNIIRALREGINVAELGKKLHPENEPIIFFLTDGEPNVEESDPKEITQKITATNQNIKCPIFSLALGRGADFKFLTSLSLSNYAFAKKIYVAGDTHLQLKNFYKQIASPLLSNVSFHYVPEQVETHSLTKSKFSNYFFGSELTVAGKLSEKYRTNDITVDLAARFKQCEKCQLPHAVSIVLKKPSEESINGLERLWAYMYIKQLLDEDVVNGTKDSSIKKKALDLSLQYSFVTPLTSLVVVKPNETEASAIKPADESDTTETQAFYSQIYSRSGYHSSMQPLSYSTNIGFGLPIRQYAFVHDRNSLIIGGSKPLPHPPVGVIPEYATTTHLPLIRSTSLPTSTLKNKLTINDVVWLNSTIKLPSSDVEYIVESHNPNIFYQNCTTAKYGPGYCRYIKFCVLPEIIGSYNDYLPYSCAIHNKYAGVCCPQMFQSV